ncbi:MAG: DapH/DapD/GlmU-related protein [Deltaproteobacteria bacterium]
MDDKFSSSGSRSKRAISESLEKDYETAWARYQQIYVGSETLRDFFRYEFLMILFSRLPGSLGFALRKVFYKKIFAAMGTGTVIGPFVTLRSPGRIILGNNVYIDEHVLLDAKGKQSSISIGNDVLVAGRTALSCATASISVANEVSIGPFCYVRASRGNITIGSHVSIGAHSVIISGNPDYRCLDIPMMKQEGMARGIRIGDDVWIGVGARIIDGVNIGDGCVVGAGAVVTKDIPDFSIVAGVPATILRYRKVAESSRDVSVGGQAEVL